METEQTGMEITPTGPHAVSDAYKEGYHAAQENGHLTPLERALERGLDVDVIERLVALQERREERDAEAAMAEALAAFQADCPPVPRVATADVRKNGAKVYDYAFAPLDEILRVIRPHLAKHGLSFTHDSVVGNGEVEVICTLQHVMGAKRTSKFRGPFDTSGGKNPLQAVGSSRSYGKRYTVTDVLGIATEEDDDGVGSHRQQAPVEAITDQEAADLDVLIDEVGADKAKFLRFMNVKALTEIPKRVLPDAISALEQKRDTRRGGT